MQVVQGKGVAVEKSVPNAWDRVGLSGGFVPQTPESSPQDVLYASLTSLDIISIHSTLRPAINLHLGVEVWGAAGGCYRRVDGDLLAWMAALLERQAEHGKADSDAHARSMEFLKDLTLAAAEHGITPSPEPPGDFRISFNPPQYCASFLTQ